MNKCCTCMRPTKKLRRVEWVDDYEGTHRDVCPDCYKMFTRSFSPNFAKAAWTLLAIGATVTMLGFV